jgi:aconitate hydratase
LGLQGDEVYDIIGLPELLASKFANGRQLQVRATNSQGVTTEFSALVRIDTPQEILYYEHGGILQFVLRQLLASKPKPETATVG